MATAARYERTAGLHAEAMKADRSFDENSRDDGQYWRNAAYRPANDLSMKALAAPQHGSFLANPISEMESRHRFLEAEYRSYMQRPKSRTPEPPREVYASDQVKSKQRRKEVLQEPKEEVYFPFGKPGGGAPLRDPKTRFLEDIPSPQPPAARDRHRRGEPSPAKIVSGLTVQDRENKFRQQEEMRRLLDEQLGQRRRRLEEEKRARLAEDQLEEARLERQRREMEEEYRRELRSRDGLPDPPAVLPKPAKSRPQVPSQPPPEERREERRPEPEARRYQPAPFVHEEKVQRLRDEMAGRQQGLQELIMKLKEESAGLSAKHYDAVREFELLREDLRAKKSQNDSIFQIPHNPGIAAAQWREPPRPRIQHESRFLPISQAGLSVVSDRSPVPPSLLSFPPPAATSSYSDIESAEISHQLSKLDSILDYCRAPLSTVD